MKFKLILLSAIITIFAAVVSSVRQEPVAAESGTASSANYNSVKALPLTDSRGGDVKLADLQGEKVLVLAVLGTECPIVKLTAAKLQKLADDYGTKGVAVVGVNPNRHDSLAEIINFAKQHQLTIPMLKDAQQKVIQALNAQRTPEFFVIDRQGKVAYQGRFDDQHGIGRSRPEPTTHDLRNALDQVLAGKTVTLKQTSAPGCLIAKTRPVLAESSVSYTKDVAPILQKHCVECHRTGEIGPFSLTEYQEVAGWADMLVEVTHNKSMPPWHADPKHGKFQNARTMSDSELKVLRDWVAAGTPEGNASDLPAPRKFTEGWQLPREPDQVFYMAEKPFPVKSSGEVRYQFFTVDPGFKEDQWISAMEVVPGCRAVVHHVIVFAGTNTRALDPEKQFLCAYVPGLRSEPLPTGMAKRIPAGSKLVFQMHYTPIGTPQEDRTKIGLIYADPKSITHEVRTESVNGRPLRIEPMKKNQEFQTKPITVPTEMQLLTMIPHMHLRGQSFRYELTWPDGRVETLLDVPNYDFNWQTAYRLANPLKLPQGAKVRAIAKFDNSPENQANPDPSKTVHWGDQSWDEMFLGYFDIAVPLEAASDLPKRLIADWALHPEPEKLIGTLMRQFDKNNDGKITREEAGARNKGVFEALDEDKNGEVTDYEILRKLKDLRDRNSSKK